MQARDVAGARSETWRWWGGCRAHRLLGVVAFASAVVSFGAGVASAVSPDDLCSGDPCVIAQDVAVGADADLSFGARNVVLRAILDAGDNTFTLRAGSFTVEKAGQLQGSGVIAIEVEGEIHIDAVQSRGAVRMVAEEGGDLRLYAGTSISGDGKILLSANDSEGDGGDLTVRAGGDVSLGGAIEAVSGSEGTGGDVEIVATGSVALTGDVDLSGGGFDGGTLDITSGGSITLGFVTLDGSGDLGNGGDLSLEAAGDVTLGDDLQTRGSAASADQCGDGGSVDVSAGGQLLVLGKLDVSGRDGDCWGGDIDLGADSLSIEAALLLSGVGRQGRGGELSVSSVADFVCATAIDLSGPDFGGELHLQSAANLSLAPGCAIDGSGPGAFAELLSGGRLDFEGNLRVGSTSAGVAHSPTEVQFTACSMLLGDGASVRSVGVDSTNTLTVAGDLVLRGSLQAGGGNSFVVPPGSVPLVLGAITPRATTVFDPALVPCGEMATPTPTTANSVATPTTTGVATPTPTVTRTVAGATGTPTREIATPTATPTATTDIEMTCAGDCNGDGTVAISELVRLVNIALGRASDCAALRAGETVGIPLIVRAVRASLNGC